MSTGSVQGSRQHKPVTTEAASGPSATAQAAGGSPAATASQAAPARTDSYGAASGAPASSAMPGGAARPSGNRAALRAKATSAAAPGVGTADNPAVFDKAGKLNPKSLSKFGQLDKDDKTTSDEYRCTCNSAVASMALKGKDALLNGITNIRNEIIKDMANIGDPAALGKAAGQFPQIIELEAKAKTGQLTTQDLNKFADLLAKRYDSQPDSPDKTIMLKDDVLKMQKGVGLVPADAKVEDADMKGPKLGQKWTMPISGNGYDYDKLDPRKIDAFSTEILGKLQNGQSAMVGVYNGTDKSRDQPNHAIMMGKDDKGQIYAYNPAGKEPHYKTGADAVNQLKSMIGLFEGDWTRDSSGMKTYDMFLGATFTPHNNDVKAR